MINFANKTFIVTGASSGIGKALALKLAQQGAKLVNLILKAMQGRKRELVMTSQGRFGSWLKLIAPDLLDRIVYQKFFTK